MEPDPALPALDLGIVDDDSDLATAVDEAIVVLTRTDPGLVRIAEELRFQGCVLRCVAPEAWSQFLEVEALVNARFADLTVLLCRWAFTQGFSEGERSGRRSSGGS